MKGKSIMQHNHGKELKEWLEKKEKEERLLRQLGVEEKTLQILRSCDYRLFLDDRSDYYGVRSPLNTVK